MTLTSEGGAPTGEMSRSTRCTVAVPQAPYTTQGSSQSAISSCVGFINHIQVHIAYGEMESSYICMPKPQAGAPHVQLLLQNDQRLREVALEHEYLSMYCVRCCGKRTIS